MPDTRQEEIDVRVRERSRDLRVNLLWVPATTSPSPSLLLFMLPVADRMDLVADIKREESKSQGRWLPKLGLPLCVFPARRSGRRRRTSHSNFRFSEFEPPLFWYKCLCVCHACCFSFFHWNSITITTSGTGAASGHQVPGGSRWWVKVVYFYDRFLSS